MDCRRTSGLDCSHSGRRRRREQITVSVTENKSEDDRTGSFTLNCGTASETISVTQYGAIKTDYADLRLEDTGTSATYSPDTGTLTVTYDRTTPPDVGAGLAKVDIGLTDMLYTYITQR